MRRAFVERASVGVNRLDDAGSHHVRDVLRLRVGDQVELFDAAGACGTGRITSLDPVLVEVEQLSEQQASLAVTIASAVPKGDRADWLVEKLSEVGAACWVPMRTERSVVVPKGAGKRERWQRIATEAAKQCHRVGVMRIEAVASFDECLSRTADLKLIADANSPDAGPLSDLLREEQTGAGGPLERPTERPSARPTVGSVLCLVGPEGGFTDDELRRARSRGFQAIRLTQTILRVETAAILAAGILLAKPTSG
jgi:16S rRNA (uracil1498-N3)-methyltransferase